MCLHLYLCVNKQLLTVAAKSVEWYIKDRIKSSTTNFRTLEAVLEEPGNFSGVLVVF